MLKIIAAQSSTLAGRFGGVKQLKSERLTDKIDTENVLCNEIW